MPKLRQIFTTPSLVQALEPDWQRYEYNGNELTVASAPGAPGNVCMPCELDSSGAAGAEATSNDAVHGDVSFGGGGGSAHPGRSAGGGDCRELVPPEGVLKILMTSLKSSLEASGCRLHRTDDDFLDSTTIIHRRYSNALRRTWHANTGHI